MRSASLIMAVSVFLLQSGVAGKDATFIAISKSVFYTQNGTAAPVIQPNGYAFRARVELSRPRSVSEVTLRNPPPAATLRPLSDRGDAWEYSVNFPSGQALNLAQPNGTYSLVTQSSADGRRTNVLTLSADVYPNPVHIANFTAAQAVNARADFLLQWDPPATTANDFIQVRIYNADQLVFETGGIPGAAGTLGGLTTSVLIPKNTLPDGGVFRAQVIANRRSTVDTTGYPGVPAWAMYARVTEFTMRTIFPTLDVRWHGLAKVRKFAQTSAAAPTPVSPGGFAINAFAIASDALNLESASLKLPNGPVKPLAGAGAAWSFNEAFATQALLDSLYVSGNYEVTLQTTHNGTQRITFTLPNSSFAPPIHVSNWNEASTIDSSKPFLLSWSPVPGGTAADFCQVTVRKAGEIVARSGEYPGATGALDGKATSFNLPAGLLDPAETAEVVLTFFKSIVTDPFSYPQAIGTAAFGSETRVTIAARPPTPPPPTLSSLRLDGTVFEFGISAVEGRPYRIQTAPDFESWTDLMLTNAPSSSFLLRIPATERAQGFRVLIE